MRRRGGPVAFVLSGGASLGAVQVGMLRALYERGIVPDLLVATSVGAVNAAFIASRPPEVATADELADVWCAIRRSDVFPAHPIAGLLGFLGQRNSLVPNSGLRNLLERHVQIRRLEGAPVPLHVVAAEILSGRERRLSYGDAISAVLASAAVPAVLPPVRWGDEELIDGGISNNTPISHALELGAEQVYILSTGYACQLKVPPRGALGMLLHALTLLIQQRLVRDVESFKGRARLVVLPPPCPLDVSPADFSRAAYLIERSLIEARRFLSGSAWWSGYRPPHERCPSADEHRLTSPLHEQVFTPAGGRGKYAQSPAHIAVDGVGGPRSSRGRERMALRRKRAYEAPARGSGRVVGWRAVGRFDARRCEA